MPRIQLCALILVSMTAAASAQAQVDVVTLAEQPWYEAADKAVAREYASPRNSSAQDISIADIKVPAGVTVTPHRHAWEEIYIIEAGAGEMMVENVTTTVTAGQSVVIPPDQWHNIANTGDEELRLTVVCSPAWREDGLIFTPREADQETHDGATE